MTLIVTPSAQDDHAHERNEHEQQPGAGLQGWQHVFDLDDVLEKFKHGGAASDAGSDHASKWGAILKQFRDK